MNFVKPHKFTNSWTLPIEFPLGRVDVDVSEIGVHQIRIGSGSCPKTTKPLPKILEPLEAFLKSWPHEPAPLKIPLVGSPTDWQLAVWDRLLKIPSGETQSYGEVARLMGRPTAARAVARACASNDWCLLIPCHRVLGANGAISGYRWGVEWKPRLIQLEWEVSPNGWAASR